MGAVTSSVAFVERIFFSYDFTTRFFSIFSLLCICVYFDIVSYATRTGKNWSIGVCVVIFFIFVSLAQNYEEEWKAQWVMLLKFVRYFCHLFAFVCVEHLSVMWFFRCRCVPLTKTKHWYFSFRWHSKKVSRTQLHKQIHGHAHMCVCACADEWSVAFIEILFSSFHFKYWPRDVCIHNSMEDDVDDFHDANESTSFFQPKISNALASSFVSIHSEQRKKANTNTKLF